MQADKVSQTAGTSGGASPPRGKRLIVSLFGGLNLHCGGHKIELRIRKAEALVGYLALSPTQSETRERIVGLLWSETDESHARASLRQVLLILRSAFAEHGFQGLSTSKTEIALDAAAVDLDVRSVLESVDAGRPSELLFERAQLSETLLAGYDDLDQSFGEWLTLERSNLLQRLMRRLDEQLANAALSRRELKRVANALIQLNPGHEGGFQALIRQYADDGDTGGALAAYKKLWDWLDEEYAMEPSEKTQELIAAIKSGSYRSAPLAPSMQQVLSLADTASHEADTNQRGDEVAVLDRQGKPHEAAIVHVHISGYSQIALSHLAAASQLSRMLQDQVIAPTVAQRKGRLIKVVEETIFLEFASATEAVECVFELQRKVRSFNEQLAADQRLILRAGIHVAEAVAAGNDLVGDEVRIPSTLLGLTDQEGIVVSGVALARTASPLKSEFEDLGAIPLEGVAAPMRAFRWSGFGAPKATASFRVPLRPPPNLPSIAVIPFRNLGLTAADDYFAQGLVEDIVISLAGLRELFVVSRASTLAFSAHTDDFQSIGRALGVRYVLVGTLRRTGGRLRVSVQLCDAQSGATLWAETTDIEVHELFDVQDSIVQRVVTGIAPNVHRAELQHSLRKRPESFTAYDYTLQALHLIFRLERRQFEQSRAYLQMAIEADPDYAMPFAWAARWHNLNVGQGWSADVAADTHAALRLAAAAIQLEPNNSLGLATYGLLQAFLRHDHDCARIYVDKALLASPNDALAWAIASITSSFVGQGDEAVRRSTQALRLSPFDRNSFYFYGVLSLAYYVCGDYEEGVKWARVSAGENPQFTANLRVLAACLAAANRPVEAREAGQVLLAREPDFTLARFRAARLAFKKDSLRNLHLEHLRIAGIPD
jgi:adenylate cyclase